MQKILSRFLFLSVYKSAYNVDCLRRVAWLLNFVVTVNYNHFKHHANYNFLTFYICMFLLPSCNPMLCFPFHYLSEVSTKVNGEKCDGSGGY